MSEHWWIARKADDIVSSLIEKDETSMPARDAVATALYVRYLKRISAHLMNIASSIVNPFERIGFRVEGHDDIKR
jgi:phosphate uptake regulator